MPLQERAALIGLDRLVELAAAGLEALDDLLELLQRLLEAHLRDVGRQHRLAHDSSRKKRRHSKVTTPAEQARRFAARTASAVATSRMKSPPVAPASFRPLAMRALASAKRPQAPSRRHQRPHMGGG